MPRGDKVKRMLSELQGFTNYLQLNKSNVKYPTQDPNVTTDFSELEELEEAGWDKKIYLVTGMTGYTGRLFENLAVAILGGKLNDQIYSIGEDYDIKPDVKYEDGNWAEVKSCVIGNQQKLEREQLAKFAYWLLEDAETCPKFDFFFFQHGVYDLRKGGRKRKEVLAEMRSNLLYCIHLPFSVPLQFFISKQKPKFKLTEYSSDGRGIRGYGDKSLLSVSSMFLPSMIEHPKKTLESLGLKVNRFGLERQLVKGLSINGSEIKEFPLLTIRDNYYRKWSEENRDRLEEFIEESRVSEPQQEQKKIEQGAPWENGVGGEDDPLF